MWFNKLFWISVQARSASSYPLMMKPSTASQTANTFVRKIFCVTFNVVSENRKLVTNFVNRKGLFPSGQISALVLVGVASNFYITLTDIETGIDTQKNCTLVTPSSNGDLSNFCNHIRIWKFCGLYGIFLPGCLAFILGSIALRSAMNEVMNHSHHILNIKFIISALSK